MPDARYTMTNMNTHNDQPIVDGQAPPASPPHGMRATDATIVSYPIIQIGLLDIDSFLWVVYSWKVSERGRGLSGDEGKERS
ncbi:hypothetical protein EBZ35_03615 [bacterium]|nr:hypothetical protein [bacterium]